MAALIHSSNETLDAPEYADAVRAFEARLTNRKRMSGVDEAISMLFPQALLAFRKADPIVHVPILQGSSSEQHIRPIHR